MNVGLNKHQAVIYQAVKCIYEQWKAWDSGN